MRTLTPAELGMHLRQDSRRMLSGSVVRCDDAVSKVECRHIVSLEFHRTRDKLMGGPERTSARKADTEIY